VGFRLPGWLLSPPANARHACAASPALLPHAHMCHVCTRNPSLIRPPPSLNILFASPWPAAERVYHAGQLKYGSGGATRHAAAALSADELRDTY